jgi:hypothetical protein
VEKSAVWNKREITRVRTVHKAKKGKEAHLEGRTWPAKQFLGRVCTFPLKSYALERGQMTV